MMGQNVRKQTGWQIHGKFPVSSHGLALSFYPSQQLLTHHYCSLLVAAYCSGSGKCRPRLGARVVVAVNLDADRLARGATIASHGSDPTDEAPEPPPATAGKALLGWRGIFGPERTLKRQMFASDARPGFSTVMIEAFNIMQDRLTRMRLAGDPPDVHITPQMGHVGWIDFHKAADAIAAGKAATERTLEPILESIAALS